MTDNRLAKLFTAGLLLITISGCSAADDKAGPINNAQAPQPTLKKTPPTTLINAKVYGIQIAAQEVTFTVISNGCTQARDFQLKHQITDKKTTATLYRIKPDYCRAAPRLIEVKIALAPDIDSQKMTITNPVLLTESPKKGANQ